MFDRKRILRHSAQQVAKARVETRDAIVWEVLPSQRLCKIKIQGSTRFLYARYPQNWEDTPQYLKAGNAVRVAHRGGNRTILEIVGHGRNVPTFPDSTDAPDPIGSTDAVLTGLDVLPVYGELQVTVTPGTFRISGVTYATTADPAGTISFTAPSSGYWRYDLLVIGADLTVDKVAGTQATSDPTMPAVPSGHVKVGHVLLYGGMTAITEGDVNKEWQLSVASSLIPTEYDPEMEWLTNSLVITTTVKDQFGLDMAGAWQIKGTIEEGGGSLDDTDPVTTLTVSTSNTAAASFTLYRLAPSSDVSCKIRFELVGYENKVYTYVLVAFLDELGDIII